ncbi:MAG: 16S rRNA (guanine(966)-N(2))-methyltransferase RsmD [Nitrospiraceae bacterium]|nr:MAG: 16S rRNA (guanine(966)-N(2))-methyltransferase RsmD [Nitrospiraceae bacterium]
MKTLKKRTRVRPTTSKAREALFDILRGNIAGACFLDLYAGSGAVGIDALKEGASDVVFVEASRGNVKKIDELIVTHGYENKSRVLAKKVLSFIGSAETEKQKFDIIFLDPPYHTDEIMHALSAISNAAILEKGGTVIAEHFKKKQLPDIVNNLKKIKEYNYGDTVFTCFINSDSQEQ